MAKDEQDGSPLVMAARAFDAELKKFERATAAAQRRPLDSEKNLERTAAAIQEAADAEQNLGPTAQALVGALQAAREQQERQAELIRARALELAERLRLSEELMARYRAIGEQAAALTGLAQTLAAKKRQHGTDSELGMLTASLGELDQRVLLVTQDAQDLAAGARAAGFEQIATEAHTLYQTLASTRNKLNLLRQSFGGGPAPS